MARELVVRQDNLLGLALGAIEGDPTLQASTKRKYRQAVTNYTEAGNRLDDPQALAAYSRTVGNSTRAFLKAVITKLSQAIEQRARGAATAENVLEVQALIYRAQALQGAIKTVQSKGEKAHTWLTQVEVEKLLEACSRRSSGNKEFDIIRKRDRLAIGLMVAAGLRRKEAVSLTFQDVKTQNDRTVLEVQGKGAKDRVVPISKRLAEAIQEWHEVVGDGYLLRSLGRDKIPGQSLTTTALYNLVQKRGELIGKPDLQPHDLRRTYAQLGLEAGIPIEQISKLLGHANIRTTQRYLNIDLDLETTISDFVPF
jgi:integrase